MEDFSFIKENCNESKMFRNNSLSQLTLRDAADSVFLNLLTLYLLSKEFETRPFAQDYATRTIGFGNFTRPRVSGTDLYQGLHIITNPGSNTAQMLKATEQNSVLSSQLHTNVKMVKDFLHGISYGNIDRTTAIRLMYRIEGQMGVDVSNYKSLRRLITDWENLSSHQRQLCVTRLLQYYRVRGKRSDLLPMIENLARNKNWELETSHNAEVSAFGAGVVSGSRSSNGFLSSVAKVGAAAAIGYAVGRHI
jgi:hypothetical protein